MRLRKLGKRKYKKQRKIIVVSLIAFLFIMVGGYAAFQTNLNITAKGNIVDRSRVIQSWTETSNEDFHTDYYKENIVSATFLDDARVPNNAVESWDVSESKDKGVMAWVVQNSEDNTKYDLYIGANGGVIANKDSSSLFFNFVGLTSIEFAENFDTSNARSFGWAFGQCQNLVELDLSSFDTTQVTYMGFMFRDCISLTKLNLSSFTTNKVTSMQDMFYNCSSIVSLDLSNFNTSNVTNMNATFLGCRSLKELDVSNFNTTKVTTMYDMFASCVNLVSLNLSSFNTSNVVEFQTMFYNCQNLSELNLCSFNTRNATNMNNMFANTNNLKNVYVGNDWDTSNSTIYNMFYNSGVSSVTTGQC